MKIRASVIDWLAEGALVERGADGTPVAFRVWRAGLNVTDKGAHTFSPRSAELLLAAQAARGNLFSVDVDHLSLSEVAPPEARKAVGWHRLAVRDGEGGPELWAVDCSWTDVVAAGLVKNPPEWRYFSPAYDVDPKTGEINRYLNTAITNNPATWNVTALAAFTAESQMPDELTKCYAAYAAAKEAGDEDGMKAAKKAAKAAMASAFGGDDDEEPKKEEKASEGEDEPKKASAGGEDEEPKKEAKAASVAASVVDIRKIVVETVREITKESTEAAERARILASRPDLPEKVVALVKRLPVSAAKAVVDAIEPAAKKAPAAVNAITASATLGETQGKGAAVPTLDAEMKLKMDQRMGLRPFTAGIQREGIHATFHPMTPEECRAFIKAKAEQKAKAAG